MSDYERERQERIAANQALLASLKIDSSTRAKDAPADVKKSKKAAPSAASHKRKRAAVEPAPEDGPTRSTRSRAARISTLEQRDPELAKRKREEEEEAQREAVAERKRLKHADREIEIWNPTGRFEIPAAVVPLKRALEAIVTSGPYARALHGSIKTASPSATATPAKGKSAPASSARRSSGRASKKAKKEESEDEEVPLANGHSLNHVDYDDDVKPSIGIKSLTDTFAAMEMKAVKRITPDRLYSAALHPTEQKDLVFVGDRKGWLGIWDASADASGEALKTEDDEEDEYDRNAFVQRVFHDHGTIARLQFDPVKAHTLYTSSYDCTVRCLDFEKAVWREAVDVDALAAEEEGEGEALISGFEITRDGNQIWVSDNGGGVTHQDLRQPTSTAVRWKVAESKAGCISLNPANENYFATSHLNRDVRMWDVRMLRKLDSATSSHEEVYDKACTAVYEHGRACSSAYFDPSGRHLLSTAYDNYLRIWDVHPNRLSEKDLAEFTADHRVSHDNETGAYVSVFKATWCPNPTVEPFFTIGNMKKHIDIYSKEGKLLHQLGDGVETIPAVTAWHPSKASLVGAAAGGKVYYWTTDKWL